MFPLFMHMLIKNNKKRPVRLYLPIFLAWILIFILMIAFFPIVLLITILSWVSGCGSGSKLILFYPLVISILWNLSGLHIEIRKPKEDTVILFK